MQHLNRDLLDYSFTKDKSKHIALKILCVLVIIWSAIRLLVGISNLVTFSRDFFLSNLTVCNEYNGTDPKTAHSVGIISIVFSIISAITSLFGLYLIWNLKRRGFFIYLLSYLTFVIPGLLALNVFYDPKTRSLSHSYFAGLTIDIAATLLFLILFTFNVKKLKKMIEF
jgi:hypothetical protein